MGYVCSLCGKEALSTAHVCKQATSTSSSATDVWKVLGTPFGNSKLCKHNRLPSVCLTCTIVQLRAEVERLDIENEKLIIIVQARDAEVDRLLGLLHSIDAACGSLRDDNKELIDATKIMPEVKRLCEKICNSDPEATIREVESLAHYIGHWPAVLQAEQALKETATSEENRKLCRCPRCSSQQIVDKRNLIVACVKCSKSYGDQVTFSVTEKRPIEQTNDQVDKG